MAGLDPARPNRLDGTILPQVAAQVLATLEAPAVRWRWRTARASFRIAGVRFLPLAQEACAECSFTL